MANSDTSTYTLEYTLEHCEDYSFDWEGAGADEGEMARLRMLGRCSKLSWPCGARK
jgi:hypothetical protein